MSTPISDFCYYPLSGKVPLEVTFVNLSKNLGGTDPWNSCPLGKKYFHSPFTQPTNSFTLDFTGISNVNTLFDENGFKLSNGTTSIEGISNWTAKDWIIHNGSKWIRIDKTYQYGDLATSYKGIWDASSNTPLLGNNGVGGVAGDYYTVDVTGNIRYPGSLVEKSISNISVDCNDDFFIQFTIVNFSNWHGTIELYFPNIQVDVYNVNPGIHINTLGQDDPPRGYVRGINNFGISKVISEIVFPSTFKFEKKSDVITLSINDKIIHSLGAHLMGLNSGIHPLELKISTQTDIKNWVIHLKDLYILNQAMPNNCQGFPAIFEWDFDDGKTDSDMHPRHVFEEGGAKTVTVSTTTEDGTSIFAQNIFINGNGDAISNADEIYNQEKSKIVKNIQDVPNYCSNLRFRRIVNAAIHDAIRHSDIIKDGVTARVKATFGNLVDDIRDLRCETTFLSGLNHNRDEIKTNLIGRTVVEPDKQDDLVDVTFEYTQGTV